MGVLLGNYMKHYSEGYDSPFGIKRATPHFVSQGVLNYEQFKYLGSPPAPW